MTDFLTPAHSSHSSFHSAEGDEEADAISDAARSRLRDSLAALVREVVATSPLTGAPDAEPANSSGRGAWQDCSTPGQAVCWVRIARDAAGRNLTTTAMELETVSHVANMQFVKTALDGNVWGALIPLMQFENWPQWMPICQAATTLRRWGSEQLVHLQFKLPVVRVHFEAVIYVGIVDRLAEEGYLEFLICSSGSAVARSILCEDGSGTASAPSCFFGVPLPPSPRRGSRAEVDWATLRLWPGAGCQHRARFVMCGEEKCPMESVIHMIWKMLARNLIPILAKRGSENNRQLVSPRSFSGFARLEREIAAAEEKATATLAALSTGSEGEGGRRHTAKEVEAHVGV